MDEILPMNHELYHFAVAGLDEQYAPATMSDDETRRPPNLKNTPTYANAWTTYMQVNLGGWSTKKWLKYLQCVFCSLLGSWRVLNSKPWLDTTNMQSQLLQKASAIRGTNLGVPQDRKSRCKDPTKWVLGCRSSSFPSAFGCLLMTHSGKLQGPGILSSYSNTYVYISIFLYRISSISKYILFNRVWTNIHIPYYIYTYSYRIYDVCIVNVIMNIFCNIHRNVYD